MGTLLIAAIIYIAIGIAAGYGMSRPGCPAWVLAVVTGLAGLSVAGMFVQINEREPWRITFGDALDLLLPGSLAAAGVAAYLIREFRRS